MKQDLSENVCDLRSPIFEKYVRTEHVQKNIALCISVCDYIAEGIIVQSILLAKVNLRETSAYRGECGFAFSANRRL